MDVLSEILDKVELTSSYWLHILPQSEHPFWFKMNTCSGFM